MPDAEYRKIPERLLTQDMIAKYGRYVWSQVGSATSV